MKKIGLLFIGTLLLSACKSDDNFSDDPNETSPLFADVDLYYTGTVGNNSGNTQLKYWKNDEMIDIQTTESATPTDIALKDNDVFVTGYLQETAGNLHGVVWKNGIPLYDLKDIENQIATSEALHIEGNNVHAAGLINRRQVAYWKNGALNKWINYPDRTQMQVYAMDVVGDDVYILGDVKLPESSNYVITYWKNGEEHVVSNPDELCYAADIKVIGNDVYVLGTIVEGGYQIALWKNGVRTLVDDLHIFGYAMQLFIEKNDVYIGAYMQPKGGHISPFIFKNGVRLPLDFDTGEACYLRDLYVNNGDVYAVGNQHSKGIIWKNGAQYPINIDNAHIALYNLTGAPKKQP